MDRTRFWKQFLDALPERSSLSRPEVDTWLGDAQLLDLTDDTLVIQLPNSHYVDWCEANFRTVFAEVASAIAGRPLEVAFCAAPESHDHGLQLDLRPRPRPRPTAVATGLNPRQTFDEFVVGACNQFAHAAARAVADHPATNFNPLFIYGATGLGKTHLMHAIGNHVVATRGSSVVYVTGEDFANEMIQGIRYDKMGDFRGKYRRSASVLLVDDIQFLSGKERTQEEFFHTFNALQASGRQIVLTSDVVPAKIEGLEPRLRTRFEGGLLADMQAPDPETLTAILRKKAERLRLDIPQDLADAIVRRVAGNVRELEGMLNKLSALHNLYGEPITLAFAQKHLPEILRPVQSPITAGRIIEAVARFHNLRSADLTGKRRTRALTRPRHIAMYLARRHTDLSFPELGKEFGGRDHSTIQHGFHKVQKELPRDADLAHKIRLIEQSLNITTTEDR